MKVEGALHARIVELESALRRIRLNIKDDIFVDPIKRRMYVAVIDAALGAQEDSDNA